MVSAAPDPCARERGLSPLDAACEQAARYAWPIEGREAVPLGESDGRITSDAVLATLALPRFDQSAMDGYAIRADDAGGVATVLALGGRVAAGHVPHVLEAGQAARIFTGAPIPPGCDAVVMQEHAACDGARVTVDGPVRPGSNVRRAGEDVREGQSVIAAGTRLGPRHVALMAALGMATVTVRRRPRVAILSTGRELRQPGEGLDGAAVYDANRPMLLALARGAGVEAIDRGHVGDDPAVFAQALAAAALASDLVVTSGGASVGEEDHSAAALRLAGADFEVLRMALKPGKPAVIGRLGGCAVLCLPGNPGAALVTWMTLGGAMLAAMAGRSFGVEAVARYPSVSHHVRSPGRREFVPARIVEGLGGPALQIIAKAGSGRILPLVEADGFADLAPGTADLRPGDLVPFHSFAAGTEAWSHAPGVRGR